MDLYMVGTPFQLVNAIEARHRYPTDKAVLILLVHNRPPAAFEALLEEVPWHAVHTFAWNAMGEKGGRSLGRARTSLGRLFRIYWEEAVQARRRIRFESLARRYVGANRVLLGNYLAEPLRHLANMVHPKEVVLLDDGTDTLRIAQDRFRPSSPPSITKNGLLKRMKGLVRRSVIDWDDRPADAVTFFTAYELAVPVHDRIERNSYPYWRSRISLGKESHDVLFLGQPLVEQSMLRMEDYLEALAGVHEYYGPRVVTYVPHPRESDQTAQAVHDSVGWEVQRFPNPIEIEVATGTIRPLVMASFFCSALETCSVLFERKMELVAFRLDRSRYLQEEEFFEDIYEYFEKERAGEISVVLVAGCTDVDTDPPAGSELDSELADSSGPEFKNA